MATLKQKIAAERKMRELIANEGLPEPTSIEYGHTCIRLFWEASNVCLVIDIDEAPPGFKRIGEQLGSADEVLERLEDLHETG